ncbi:MAG: YidB family protein, partial [Gemmatimonadales bacterium]
MALLDGLVTEVADRFGLGAKAGPLVSGLLASLTDGQQGGIAGFLDRFRQAGLGNLVNSWIGHGGNSTLAPEQLDQALGTDTVER